MATATDYCKHDMVLDQCTVCRPKVKVPAQDRVLWGPWMSVKYPVECAGCGDRIVAGQQIRSNGRRGQWLCTICGTA